MKVTNEREYMDWVNLHAESVRDLIEEGVPEDEALHQEADNMVIYYIDQRSIIRWTDHLDAVDDMAVGLDCTSAQDAIAQIAYWSAYMDLEQRL